MLYADFETLSESNIRESGASAYARHHTTGIICCGFKMDTDPTFVYVPPFQYSRAMRPENALIVTELPQNIIDYISAGGPIMFHNAGFDFDIWNEVAVRDYGWPPITVEQTHDSMALGCAMAMPANLEGLGEAVGSPILKDKRGAELIRKMSKPPFQTSPELLGDMVDYCARDVDTMAEIVTKLRPLSDFERRVWESNFKANQRGIALDTDLIHNALYLSDREDEALGEIAQTRLGVSPACLRSQVQFRAWAESKGEKIEALSKAYLASYTVKTPIVAEALKLREQVCKTSIKKFHAMLARACPDGRARGNMVYHKATTGRYAGSGIQTQNLPRPALKDPDSVADLVAREGRLPDDLTIDTKTALSSLLRSCIIAPEGREFYCLDYSSIESRVLFWLAGEEKGLNVYRRGDDLYCVTASGIYERPINKADHPTERSVGKVAVLSLGYAGGVKAFTGMCEQMGVDLHGQDPKHIVDSYRATYSKTSKFWYDCEDAAMEAIRQKGLAFRVGKCRFKFSEKHNALVCSLPSGRLIWWPEATINKKAEMHWGGVRPQIEYKGLNLARKWITKRTYGGDIAQSLTQATARDLLADAMVRLDGADFPIVLHVHDEVLVEMPKGVDRFDEFRAIMSTGPEWADGIPIAVDGWRGHRYQK